MKETVSPGRRDVLLAAGAMISASALQACAASLGPRDPDEARHLASGEGLRDAASADLPLVLRVLVLALHAPSAHNTQAWRFRVVSDREALLYVDAARLLPETDPPARQIHISCGCFAEAFSLGAGRFGMRPRVELFPEGRYRSSNDVGNLPVARLALDGVGAEDPLAAYIESRQTSRLVYEGPLVSEADFAPVLAAAGVRSTRVTFVSGAAMKPFLSLFGLAMAVESTTLATNEETRSWFRFDDAEAAERRDGLTFEGSGVRGLDATFARMAVSNTKASWNDPDTIDEALDVFRDAVGSARGLLWLSTSTNRVEDQIASGRDCYRLMLALTRSGYFSHPLNQVLQEYEAMRPLRERFEAASAIASPAKVQMILRIGRSEVPAISFRRHASAFLIEGGAS